ncbi:hypothetical protein C0J45_12785 [Silurus meridionalis]|nr:hypothetical protein C0J45_12785 [Silurus meridionalis]
MFTPASLNDTFISPTSSPANTPTDQLTAVMISLSCLVVVVLLVLLGSVIYCKLPFCCKSRAYQDSHADLEPSSQHYSSRQTLVGSPCTDLPPSLETLDNINPREPPTYEETVRQTLQSLQTQDAPFNPIPPPSRPPLVPPQPMDALPQYEELAHSTTSPDTDNDPQPRDSE